jgi:hypothetical protein
MCKKLLFVICGLWLATNCNSSHAAVVLSDNFSYAAGSLTNVSNLKWTTHSGTGGQVDIAGGKLNLTEAESEDVNALLAGQPYATNGTTVLYGKFSVRFSALPAGTNGAYFAHFKDGTTSGFRARVFASTNGAAAGSLRLGIAAGGGNATASVATDLSLNTDYTVVVRYVVGDGTSTLWINPTLESEAGAMATDAASPLPIASIAFRQSLSSGNGMGTLQVDDLVVATTFAEALSGPSTGTAPSIVAEPADLSVAAGAAASFSVTANGSAPLGYQWRFNGVAIAGATLPIYSIVSAQAASAGGYSAIVSNSLGFVTTRVATLTVTPPVSSAPVVTNIAYLRSLVDAQTYIPTNTTTLYSAEGIVTTHVNVTTDPNALFYMQDNTAGIVVFVSGSTTIRPKAGDRVRVTGPLGHFNGLLELNLVASNPAHTVVTLSTNNPLPAPKPLAFSSQNDPALIDSLEGSLLIVTNVLLDLTQPNFPPASSGGNVSMTNQQGEVFVLRVDTRVLDITGQPKPTVPVDVIGVLAQFDTSSPYTIGYQLTPTRFADIVGGVTAPKIEFTNTLQLVRLGDSPANTFIEHVLQPGERITTSVRAFNSGGGLLTLSAPTNGLPAGAVWTIGSASGTNLSATFTYQATAAAAGQKYTVQLSAANSQATNTAVWTLYVPSAIEQRITVSEFLANPPGTNSGTYINSINRPGTPPNPSSDDETVELVNLSSQSVDLVGWTIADSVQVRHKFYDTFLIGSSNAVVVYGGPLNGSAPRLDVPIIPASENAFGFGLNNSGGDTILLRNAQSNLIARVVYSTLSTNSSMTRYPDINGEFVPQLSVSTNPVTFGQQFSGRPFNEPAPVVLPRIVVKASVASGTTLQLNWNAEPGQSYSVLRSDTVSGPFTPVASSLTFSGTQGQHTETGLNSPGRRFYIIRSP